MELTNFSRVAIIGGGPAGSLTAYFMLDIARHIGIQLNVDIYEPKIFSASGAKGCNYCGGIVSETLVQMLAMEGINLPSDVVQRGIDAYCLQTEGDGVSIRTPLVEMRIAALYRGSGPLDCVKCAAGLPPEEKIAYHSYDGFLLDLAINNGATLIPNRVAKVSREGKFPIVTAKGCDPRRYDLVVGAVGVNSGGLKVFEKSGLNITPPRTTKAFITEVQLGVEGVSRHFGNTMHVFLLDIPKISFSAIVPKGEYVTVIMLGKDLDKDTANAFLSHPKVKGSFPDGTVFSSKSCKCRPAINVGMASPVFTERLVLTGDAGVSRLYKDGLGAAYKTAKACATTALIHGVSRRAFRRYYLPTCNNLERDNKIGKMVFLSVDIFKWFPILGRGMVAMVKREQRAEETTRAMSMVLWDTFTGSGSYKSIFIRSIHPAFLARLLWESIKSLLGWGAGEGRAAAGFSVRRKWSWDMAQRQLGHLYRDGEVLFRKGDPGNCMYQLQKGALDIVLDSDERKIVRTIVSGEFFGEMSLFTGESRSATIRSRGESRVLTIDEAGFMRRLEEDPVLAFRILEQLYNRLHLLR